MRPTWKCILCFSAFVSGFGAGCASFDSTSSQLADSEWSPTVSDPPATENAQFVLNVMHWLTGALGE